MLILLVVVPLLLLSIYSNLQRRQETRDAVAANALQVAHIVAVRYEQSLRSAKNMVVSSAQFVEQARVLEQGPGACPSFFAEIIRGSALYLNIGVADAAGNVVCSGVPMSGPVSVGDREYFQEAVRSTAYAVGGYQVGRITGSSSINVAYPVIGVDGGVAGVTFAALNLETLSMVAKEAQLPEAMTVTVIDGDGVVLTRYPVALGFVGESGKGTDVIDRQLGQTEEDSFLADGLDGVHKLFAYVPMREGDRIDGYVHVVFPENRHLRRWNVLRVLIFSQPSRSRFSRSGSVVPARTAWWSDPCMPWWGKRGAWRRATSMPATALAIRGAISGCWPALSMMRRRRSRSAQVNWRR